MSIRDCLNAAVAAGKMSQKGMTEYMKRMEDAERAALQRGMGPVDAYTFAVTDTAKEMERRAKGNRAKVQRAILTIDRAWEEANRNTRGVGWGLTTIFGNRVGGKGTSMSIGLQAQGNLKTAQSLLAQMMAKLQSRAFGLKQERELPNQMVSELYGVSTGNPEAAAAAKAWNGLLDWWMKGMERAGAYVPNKDDWRLPQHFDEGAVRKMGKDAFVAQMTDWWTSNKLLLRDWEADNAAYLTPQGAPDRGREIFERAYDNITTRGEATMEPGALRDATMADRYSRRRAFEWATDEAWKEFNEAIGVGNAGIGEMLIRHVDHITRDLATIETLSPDADRVARTLIDMYRQKNAQQPGGATLGQRTWANRLEALYEISTGKAQAPVSQRMALAGQGIRHTLSAAQLSGAVLSSLSDFAFAKATASWHGLPMSKILVDYVSNLKPQSMADRVEAMRGVSLVEVGMRGQRDAFRDALDDMTVRRGPGVGGAVDMVVNGLSRIGGRMAEFVIRAQGLSHHTQAFRNSFGAQIQAHLGSVADKNWDALSAVDRRTFETYGMDAKQWEILRTQAVQGGILDPTIIARGDNAEARDAGVKMLGAIAAIERMAIPEGNAVTKAIVLGGTRPGTPEGEFLRAFAQYKGFPLASMVMHWSRGMESLTDKEGQWFRGQYMAGLIVGATVMGAASLQLKNIAAGKDPEPMFNKTNGWRFWVNAMAQGGAAGMIGDFMKSLTSASRQGDASRMLSPMGGLLMDTLSLTRGNVADAIAGVEPHFGREMIKYANKYTPDVFYTKLALDRLVWDALTKMADPEAANTFSRIEERARKEQDTRFYWRPGSDAPRGPNFENALR